MTEIELDRKQEQIEAKIGLHGSIFINLQNHVLAPSGPKDCRQLSKELLKKNVNMCKNRYVKWKKSVCSCKFTHTMTWENLCLKTKENR